MPTPNTKENTTEADCKLSIDQAALVILSRSDRIVQKTCSNMVSIDLSFFLIVVTVAVLLIFLLSRGHSSGINDFIVSVGDTSEQNLCWISNSLFLTCTHHIIEFDSTVLSLKTIEIKNSSYL